MPGVPPLHTQPLLAALSATLGQTIELDDDGQCVLTFTQDTELVLACPPSTGMLSVRAPIVTHSAQITSLTLRKALELNYGALPPGVWIALDAADGQLVLLSVLDPQALSQSRFLELLADLVALVPEARALLASPDLPADDAPWMMGERP